MTFATTAFRGLYMGIHLHLIHINLISGAKANKMRCINYILAMGMYKTVKRITLSINIQ